jgi:hypothetical protein
MWWLERIRGSGTLPASRVCDTVVICARSGRRNVGGKEERISRRHLRAERASRAIVKCAMVGRTAGISFWMRRCGLKIGHVCQAALE